MTAESLDTDQQALLRAILARRDGLPTLRYAEDLVRQKYGFDGPAASAFTRSLIDGWVRVGALDVVPCQRDCAGGRAKWTDPCGNHGCAHACLLRLPPAAQPA